MSSIDSAARARADFEGLLHGLDQRGFQDTQPDYPDWYRDSVRAVVDGRDWFEGAPPSRARVYDPEEGEPLNAEEARYVRNVCWGLAGALIGILLGVSHVAGWLRFP